MYVGFSEEQCRYKREKHVWPCGEQGECNSSAERRQNLVQKLATEG